jgi:hypothetical protein
MEKAYQNLMEEKKPEEMKPLLHPPEEKLFYVVKNSC